MSADSFTELLPAFALESLEPGEMEQVKNHLAVCAACRVELAAYRDAAGQLAWTAAQVQPPARLRENILRQAQPEPARLAKFRPLTAKSTPRLGWTEVLAQFFRRAAPAWGMVSLALVAVLAVSNLMLWQQVSRPAPPTPVPGFAVVRLTGTDRAPAAQGLMVISDEGQAGTLVVDGLPPLDAAHQYQLWLIKDGQRTSGGVFSVEQEGYGTLVISAPLPLIQYPTFGITIEPSGGSPGPTGEKVLGGGI